MGQLFVLLLLCVCLAISSSQRTVEKEKWNVPFPDIEKAATELEADFPFLKEPHRTPILFLYAKNVSKGSPWRVQEFATLIDPTSAGVLADYYAKARRRLDRLLSSEGGDTATDDPQVYAGDSFDVALQKLPSAWSSPETSFISFRDAFPGDAGVLVQRYQKSGLCYMHAPAVVQHYAICHNQSSGDGVQMVDLRLHIVHNFTSNQLKAHIFDDQRGSSKTFLESILEPGSIVKSTDVDWYGRTQLEQFGPALVSHFKVHDDFVDPGQQRFLTKPDGKYKGRHAMVLVGVREENGEKLFLVQNWWREKQFVEISPSYLEHAGAGINIVETPQKEIPRGLSLSLFHFAETEAVDLADQFDFEM